MHKRSLWIGAIALVGLAGLLAGVFLVFSLNVVGDETAAPTLAPVAAQVQETEAAQPTMMATATPSSTPPTAPAIVEEAGSPTSVIAATATPAATAAPFIDYVVQEGETLTGVALAHGVSLEAMIQANPQIGDPDRIDEGDMLFIPVLPAEVGVVSEGNATATATGVAPDEPQPAATATTGPPATAAQAVASGPPDWPPSLTSGDLSGNYPRLQQTASGAVLIHYQPGTYPADVIDVLGPRIDQIFARLQSEMGGAVPGQVDVYLGGTLFGVNPSLQGFTQSYEFRSFVLVNGAFHPGERDYILGHELSHVAATHILGAASSTMIHEGLATYLPQTYLTQDAGYLPIEQICAAAYRTNAFRSAGQLSQLSYGPDAFGGHIRTFFNYNLSGCFVGYLLESYGMTRLDQVYDSGDYRGVYGMSLSELDGAWQSTLQTTPLSVDAATFVALVEEIAQAYEGYLNASAGGFHAHYDAYLHLNQARLEANRGNLEAARRELETYRSLMG